VQQYIKLEDPQDIRAASKCAINVFYLCLTDKQTPIFPESDFSHLINSNQYKLLHENAKSTFDST
jgi:hypothetical protein